MADITQYTFNFEEVATALFRQQGISSGTWLLQFGFGIGMANTGPSEELQYPTTMIALQSIGLQKSDLPGPLVFDAARLNPVD